MDFVTFYIAKKLKEKGFKNLCFAYYTNTNDLYFNYSHKAGAKYSDCFLSHNLMPKDSVSGKFVDAPTISQVLKWLREETKINVNMRLYKENGWYYTIQNYKGEPLYSQLTNTDELYLSYEEAALAGIQFAIDNLI